MLPLKIPSLLLTAGLLCLNACFSKSYTLKADYQVSPKQLIVNGRANLPENSQVLVAWIDPKLPEDMNQNVVVQEFGLVKNESFNVTLKPFRAVPAGDYQLKLRVTPEAYDWSDGKLLAEIGTKGEKLSGPYVIEKNGVKMLQNLISFTYKGDQ